jgi:hypothetical protein
MASGANAMGWDFASKPVAGATLQFAMGFAATPNAPDPATWAANPPDASDYRFVQVTASANVPLMFMQAFQLFQSGSSTGLSAVAASSVAAQALVTNFPQGLLPFSPIAPSPLPDNFGMTPGVQYTIRYPSGGGLKNSDVCAGDQNHTPR